MEKIIIGSDHAGFKLKEILKSFIKENNYNVDDLGTFSEDAVDYPIIAKKIATTVAETKNSKGILVCGSGVGMCICANKIKGIRAVVCSDTTTARFSRMHNDSNVLCLGQRIVGEYLAKDICQIWLETNFEAERHLTRVNLIEDCP